MIPEIQKLEFSEVLTHICRCVYYSKYSDINISIFFSRKQRGSKSMWSIPILLPHWFGFYKVLSLKKYVVCLLILAPSQRIFRGYIEFLTRSRRRVPLVARTRLSHRAACTTVGARLIVPSGGVYWWLARWLALDSYRAACRPMKRDVDLYAAAGWNKCKSAPAWTC